MEGTVVLIEMLGGVDSAVPGVEGVSLVRGVRKMQRFLEGNYFFTRESFPKPPELIMGPGVVPNSGKKQVVNTG